MRIPNSPDFFTPLNTTYRSLRHLPRASTRQGLNHTTIITIAVAASVGSVLVTILCWRIFSRLSGRSRSAPLPPRQALVHQREHRLAAFSEHKNASIPLTLPDVWSSVPIHNGSNTSLIPHANDSPANTSYLGSVHAHETGEGIGDGPPSLHGSPLYPPTFFTPHLPTSASSSSLLSSNDHSSLYSAATAPATTFSTSVSPNQSSRRPNARPEPRPFSVASNGTSRTSMTRSRSSVRGAPHAPHSNVQIVLPAPLAPELYPCLAGEDKGQRVVISDNMYRDSWRGSLVDKWISVGQHAMPEPKSEKRRSRHDSIEGPSRLTRRDPSRPLPRRRSSSNPAPLSPLRQALPNSLPSDAHPPVPRVPSEFGSPPKQKGRMPSVPTGMERQ